MPSSRTLSCALTLSLVASWAQAQGPKPPVPPPPATAESATSAAPSPSAGTQPAASSEPAAEAPAESAAPAPAATNGIACVVGDHPKEYPDSARTATSLVCDALREKGVDIGNATDSGAGARAAYVVHLDQLGDAFFLRVNYEEPVGTVKKTRRASLSELPEAEVVAPRLAGAMLGDKKMEETMAYENVAGSEAREQKKRRGEFVIGGGIAAVTLPAGEIVMRPMLNVFGFYETRDWGLGLQGHFATLNDNQMDRGQFSALSVGGRYYFSDGNITPLAGIGLTLSSISESSQDDSYGEISGAGSTFYGEVGLEFFRLHRTHLIASLRLDVPFYKLSRSYPYLPAAGAPAPETERYELPITFNVGIGF